MIFIGEDQERVQGRPAGRTLDSPVLYFLDCFILSTKETLDVNGILKMPVHACKCHIFGWASGMTDVKGCVMPLMIIGFVFVLFLFSLGGGGEVIISK